MSKLCPNCSKLMTYNSYFGAYMCSNCHCRENVRFAQNKDKDKKQEIINKRLSLK